jgi:hypothetical protein
VSLEDELCRLLACQLVGLARLAVKFFIVVGLCVKVLSGWRTNSAVIPPTW